VDRFIEVRKSTFLDRLILFVSCFCNYAVYWFAVLGFGFCFLGYGSSELWSVNSSSFFFVGTIVVVLVLLMRLQQVQVVVFVEIGFGMLDDRISLVCFFAVLVMNLMYLYLVIVFQLLLFYSRLLLHVQVIVL